MLLLSFVWVMASKMYLDCLLKAVIWKSHPNFQFNSPGDVINILGRSYPLKPNKTAVLNWILGMSSTSDHLLLLRVFNVFLFIALVALDWQPGFFLQIVLFFICGHHFRTETFIEYKMELWLWGWCRQILEMNPWGDGGDDLVCQCRWVQQPRESLTRAFCRGESLSKTSNVVQKSQSTKMSVL